MNFQEKIDDEAYPDISFITAVLAAQAFWDMPDIVFFLDTDGMVRFVNSAVERYGFNASEVIGMELGEFVHSKDIQTVNKRLEQRRGGDSAQKSLHVTLFDKTGKEHVFEGKTSLVLFKDDEEFDDAITAGGKRRAVLCSFGVLRDVSVSYVPEAF